MGVRGDALFSTLCIDSNYNYTLLTPLNHVEYVYMGSQVYVWQNYEFTHSFVVFVKNNKQIALFLRLQYIFIISGPTLNQRWFKVSCLLGMTVFKG